MKTSLPNRTKILRGLASAYLWLLIAIGITYVLALLVYALREAPAGVLFALGLAGSILLGVAANQYLENTK